MADDRLWIAIYLGINLAIAAGFLLLARFIRRAGRPPGAERAGKMAGAALVALAIGSLFTGKLVSALFSGRNFSMGRRGRRTWEWVTRESDHARFMGEAVMDAGFASICLVAAVCFVRIRAAALDPALEPALRMDRAIRWLFVMFWAFVLGIEAIVYGYHVLARG